MVRILEFSRSDDCSDAEWETRIELAACYRLVEKFGWTDLLANHISARVPGSEDHFLINPYGIRYDEITASALLKVDVDGNIIGPNHGFTFNPAGFVIHSAVHMARPELMCALHTHTYAGVAVSCQSNGLLPLSQMQLSVLGEVVYHDYEGIAASENLDERQRIVMDLGSSHCLIMRNHGLMTVGESVGAAWCYMYRLERACRMQIEFQKTGAEWAELSQATIGQTIEKSQSLYAKDSFRPVGTVEWEAVKRMLNSDDIDYRN